jgi:hypothetical protein
MSSGRRRLLLGALGVLLFVKFVVLPWLDWQSAQRETLMILTKRLDRSLGVVANSTKIVETRAALRTEVAKLEDLFPKVKSSSDRKLEAQRSIEEVAIQNGVSVSSFDWVFQTESKPGEVGYARARILIGGDLRSIALMHGAIESNLRGVTIRDLLVTPNGLAREPLAKSSTMSLTADFYFLEDVK